MGIIRRLLWQHILLLSLILFPTISHAESLVEALSGYPALSQFRSLLLNKPNIARLLTGASDNSQRLTFLVPSDDAFVAYRATNGDLEIADIPDLELEAIMRYHILSRSLPAAQLLSAPPNRLVIPTDLMEEKYNNRSAGPALDAQNDTGENNDGQVVIMSPQSAGSSRKRQQEEVDVLSGLHESVTVTLLDGKWDGGLFHMVDGLLTLPRVCTETIESEDLTSLSLALRRTSLGPVLDTLRNVTCIGPTDDAFEQAGNPDENAESGDLTKALTFHTLTEPVYTNFLTDGQIFTTVSNDTILVTVNATGIFFNDAKLVKKNVLTNNGVIQVVDRVMSPLETKKSSPTSNPTKSPTSSGAPSASPSKNGGSLLKNPFGATILDSSTIYFLASVVISLAWGS
ncbi:conserved hypothetical protein [Histoplasma capsulatum var. duboisii H88]|uniref:Fasciclin domain-containing protein n=1 Tax=Ajellomyces capsulatus (strain H88) TaxID=544711 RepID=F0UEN0_AJEC8|nr:conserved hypothetical protein [Histoplasma capsulatum var. duboisii H88]QSS55537.1 fasciclin domain-containing protein [Histoplasma capsulatum var. duboisii H88]